MGAIWEQDCVHVGFLLRETKGGLVDLYLGAHESNTMHTARFHAIHLKTSLGDDFAIHNLATSDLQAHIDRRARAKGRSRKRLSPTTIKKEIAGFSRIWSWAIRMGHASGAFPNKGLSTRRRLRSRRSRPRPRLRNN
jgi:hypothetical protein